MSPLIDCVFLLLVFFLVATMYKKKDKDIAIVPPESASAQRLLADDKAIVIGVDRAGNYYWEGAPATANQLHQGLRSVAAASPGRQIRLDADAMTPFESVVEVLNICQFRGLRNVGIRTYDDRYNRR
jgi:biopolymer transport protein ExbD